MQPIGESKTFQKSLCWLSFRRNRREKQAAMEGGFDDFLSLNNQLATLGLSLKQIPGIKSHIRL